MQLDPCATGPWVVFLEPKQIPLKQGVTVTSTCLPAKKKVVVHPVGFCKKKATTNLPKHMKHWSISSQVLPAPWSFIFGVVEISFAGETCRCPPQQSHKATLTTRKCKCRRTNKTRIYIYPNIDPTRTRTTLSKNMLLIIYLRYNDYKVNISELFLLTDTHVQIIFLHSFSQPFLSGHPVLLSAGWKSGDVSMAKAKAQPPMTKR